MQIHSKKRNRLAQKRLNDLVYVKYNRALKLRNLNLKNGRNNPISLQDIDESNEWLTGRMEEELVHEEEDLNWDDVALASGAEEAWRTTRSSTSKSKSTAKTKVSSSRGKSKNTSSRSLPNEEEEEVESDWEDEEEEEDAEAYKSNDDSEEDEVFGGSGEEVEILDDDDDI